MTTGEPLKISVLARIIGLTALTAASSSFIAPQADAAAPRPSQCSVHSITYLKWVALNGGVRHNNASITAYRTASGICLKTRTDDSGAWINVRGKVGTHSYENGANGGGETWVFAPAKKGQKVTGIGQSYYSYKLQQGTLSVTR